MGTSEKRNRLKKIFEKKPFFLTKTGLSDQYRELTSISHLILLRFSGRFCPIQVHVSFRLCGRRFGDPPENCCVISSGHARSGCRGICPVCRSDTLRISDFSLSRPKSRPWEPRVSGNDGKPSFLKALTHHRRMKVLC